MIRMTLDTSSADKEIKRLIALAPKVAAQALYTSAHAVLIPAIKRKIKDNKSVFRGELFQRVAARTIITADREPTVEVGSLGVPYGLNVEEGAGPHSPDADKILDYVKKKMSIPEPGASRVAASITASIESSGTKAHPFIEPAWNERRDEFFADFVNRMKAKLGT
jgi:hypothetical protein